MLNPEFRDMFAEFNIAAVEYLVVGGYAMAHYGYPRATGDMDFWIRRSPENAGGTQPGRSTALTENEHRGSRQSVPATPTGGPSQATLTEAGQRSTSA